MNEEDKNKKLSALEALLFIHGEPISISKISSGLGLELSEAEELVNIFSESLMVESRGLNIVKIGDRVQLATKPEINPALENFVKSELSEELTPASLEVLSLVSYLGPISRSKIEYLRGVNSSFTLRSLLMRGLVDRIPDPNSSIAYLYRPTFELLKHLGLTSPEEMPEYEKFRDLLANGPISIPTPPST